jgi:hydroxymethylglutaryl-CoA lyase
MNDIQLVECPRDAMQGIHSFIPTQTKIAYLNLLLKCGFDTLDFGSFVSPKAIPQLADTKEVLKGLDLQSQTKLLAIVANKRGAEEAVSFDEISFIGYPFSVSETFQLRNTNTGLSDAFRVLENIQTICSSNKKELVVYLSMGFGNPYGDTWSPEVVATWCDKLVSELGINRMAPSDTIGCAQPSVVESLFSTLITSFPNVEFGAHMHARIEHAKILLEAAYNGGCRRFDGAFLGYGGCPMAKDELTGNMPTEIIVEWMNDRDLTHGLNKETMREAQTMAKSIFHQYQ